MATSVQTPTNPDQQVDLSTIPISPEGGEKSETKENDSEKPVTVFHDKENFNVKHPLQNKWTLWFTKPPSGKVRLSRLKMASGQILTWIRATTGMIF